MDKDIVLRYITIPMAIKVFRQDKESFRHFKLGNLYLDKLDTVLQQLNKTFHQLKKEMYTIHHLDIRYLGKTDKEVKYSVNNEVITFTPEELRLTTSEIMSEYLYGKSATPFERTERVWDTVTASRDISKA
ncbi:hypothetical protein [Oceanobacillus rekensis]|uniref:hypothetical protein n=1 Tax=Oceanobacillus rekensis TaxID=937927 RepID=UPI000B44ACF5|nr:hypothetical protein [Oceanobacillus rekensis]